MACILWWKMAVSIVWQTIKAIVIKNTNLKLTLMPIISASLANFQYLCSKIFCCKRHVEKVENGCGKFFQHHHRLQSKIWAISLNRILFLNVKHICLESEVVYERSGTRLDLLDHCDRVYEHSKWVWWHLWVAAGVICIVKMLWKTTKMKASQKLTASCVCCPSIIAGTVQSGSAVICSVWLTSALAGSQEVQNCCLLALWYDY